MNRKSKTLAAGAAIATLAAILITASISPAEARRHKHKTARSHVTVVSHGHHVVPRGRYTQWQGRAARRSAKFTPRRHRVAAAAPAAASTASGFGFGGSGLVSAARSYVGRTAGQIGMPSTLWCADFMNYVLRKTGRSGTGSRVAKSFAGYGRRVSGPQVGAIAVLTRGKGGGHVGVVSGVDASGNPIIISGNHNRRVAEATYSRSRVVAYVMP